MSDIISFLRSKQNFLFIGLLWILLWVIPWGKLPAVQENLYLAFVTDMLRLGIAIGMFIIPGALLYILLRGDADHIHDSVGIIPIGFALSVFMIAVVGLLGRVAGFPFSLVRNLFALIGMVELILVMFFKPDLVPLKDRLRESFSSIARKPLLLSALAIAILMTFHDRLYFIDDTTYAAYLTNWQYSGHLGFKSIIHGIDIIEETRFWLALYPMGQALLSDLSGVPGFLLISNYLELLLVPIAVITSFWFARTLGLSGRAAGFSVLIQVSLYSWMIGEQFPVGMWFYQSMSEDKVSATFILAPVFFVFVMQFLQRRTINWTLLVLFSGFALTLTHPIILFFSCCIAFGFGLLFVIEGKTNWRALLQMLLLFSILLLPYAMIRLSGHPSQAGIPFDAETASASFQIGRYTNVVNEIFYGLNPGVLKFFDIPLGGHGNQVFQIFRLIPVMLILFSGIIAFMKRSKGRLHLYILACVLLVMFATIPYTGWLLGYFVSARMISRAAWFSPLGLGGVVILQSARDWFRTSPFFLVRKLNVTFVGLVLSFAFVSPIMALNIAPRVSSYFQELDHNKQLAVVGVYIDRNTIDQITVIALDYTDMQMFPGVSAHTKLISFRDEKAYNGHNYFLSIEQIEQRTAASNTIRSLDPSVPAEKRCMLLDKYDVRFVLAEPENVELFASLADACEKKLVNVFRTKDLTLLELK